MASLVYKNEYPFAWKW